MTYEEKHERRLALEASIVTDLKIPSLGYVAISKKYRVSTRRVQELSAKHGLTRKRGRKPNSVTGKVSE